MIVIFVFENKSFSEPNVEPLPRIGEKIELEFFNGVKDTYIIESIIWKKNPPWLGFYPTCRVRECFDTTSPMTTKEFNYGMSDAELAS